MIEITRRRFLVIGAGAAGLAIVPAPWAPARATEAEVAALIKELAGEGGVKAGRVKLDLPMLVENGNTVSMSISAAGPRSGPERVRSIHVFAPENPLPTVGRFHFGPRSGPARISTRIRLATSQTVIAIAKLEDGSCWSDSVELLVTLAACLE